MDRPRAVALFEIFSFLALALGVLQSFLAWPSLTRISSPEFVALTQGLVFATMVALTLWISRGRSKIGLWILVVLFVIGLPVVWSVMQSGMLFGSEFISLLQTILQLAGLVLLFTPPARAWFNEKH